MNAVTYKPGAADFEALANAEVMGAAASSQRTPEWYAERRGRFTGSEVWKLMTDPRTKAAKDAGELSETAKTYINSVLAELATGITPEISSAAMQWGIENEPVAKALYKELFFEEITEMGFVPYGDHSGGSPDGSVCDGKGIAEIKCHFNSAYHIENLILANSMPSGEDLKASHKEYYWQMQNNMMATGADFCRFISFDPRFEGNHRICCITLERNQADIDELQQRISAASEEMLRLKSILNL